MHLPFTSTLLLLLPLTTASHSHGHSHAHAHAHPRGVTDKVKGLFGDPAAMVNDLPLCTRRCAALAAFTLYCKDGEDGDPIETRNGIYIDCMCADGGQKWEDKTKKCFDNAREDGNNNNNGTTSAKKKKKEEKEEGEEGSRFAECGADDYEPGKLLDVCKAVGEKPDKKNETATAVLKMMAQDLFGLTDEELEQEGLGEGKKGKTSGAAALGVGGVRMVAGVVLAAAVGWAVAML